MVIKNDFNMSNMNYKILKSDKRYYVAHEYQQLHIITPLDFMLCLCPFENQWKCKFSNCDNDSVPVLLSI